MAHGIDWTLWRSLLAVVDTGTLSGAARQLGLTQPTIGRHIDALEDHFGKSLFLRSAQGLRPTELTLQLAEQARVMDHAATALARRATGPEQALGGTVRIAASEAVGTHILPRVLAPLLTEERGLKVEISLSSRLVDLVHHEADLAIRMIRPSQGTLVARHIGTVDLTLAAHETYLARHGMPETVDELKDHLLVGPDALGEAQAVLAAFQGAVSRDDLALRTDNTNAQIQAICDGLGIGAMQRGIASRKAGVVPVLEKIISWQLDAWLVMHPDTRGLRHVRRVADHLAAHLPAALQAG